MGERSKIEWTEASWNPIRGCSRISPGCEHCYAEGIAARFSGVDPVTGKPQAYHGLATMTEHGPRWTRKLRLLPDTLLAPLSWRRPRRVFVNSMSDLFHEGVPITFIAAVFAVMAATRHTFQILTKRAARMLEAYAWMADRIRGGGGVASLASLGAAHLGPEAVHVATRIRSRPWPLPNVWQGVSVENEEYARTRIPSLLSTPAAIRFVSYEPALGPVDWGRWLDCIDAPDDPPEVRQRGLQWIIVGGESGPGARPFEVRWAREIVYTARAAGVPVFVKQLGAHVVTVGTNGRLRRRLKSAKGGDPREWPPELRVRQYPGASTHASVWDDDFDDPPHEARP